MKVFKVILGCAASFKYTRHKKRNRRSGSVGEALTGQAPVPRFISKTHVKMLDTMFPARQVWDLGSRTLDGVSCYRIVF